MTPHESEFTLLKPLSKAVEITIADGARMSAVGVDDVVIVLENGQHATVKDVLFIPDLDRRLLSIAKITLHGLHIEFGSDACVIKKGGGNVYKVQCELHAAMTVEHAVQQTDWELVMLVSVIPASSECVSHKWWRLDTQP